MRLAALLALLAGLAIGQTPTLGVHGANHVASGAVSVTLNTTGGAFVWITLLSVFGNGTLVDNKSNTFSQTGGTVLVHNEAVNFYTCDSPCSVGTGHIFTQQSNGSGFDQNIHVAVFTGVGILAGGEWRDFNVLAGNRVPQHTLVGTDPPPFTVQAPNAWQQSTGQALAVSVGIVEQGTGGPMTVDGGFTIIDHSTNLSTAYLIVPAPTPIQPTWTVPIDALHMGSMNQIFLGSVSTGKPPHRVRMGTQ